MNVFVIVEKYQNMHNLSVALNKSNSFDVYASNTAESFVESERHAGLVILDIWLGKSHPVRMTAGELLRLHKKENHSYPILLLANENDQSVLRNFGSYGNHPVMMWQEFQKTDDVERLINSKFVA